MCSHHRTCAGKYLFRQKQKGWQVAQPSARTQNDALRKLAQKLPEQDNQPTIIDGLKGIRETEQHKPLFASPSSDHPFVATDLSLTVMFLLGRSRFSVPAYAFTERVRSGRQWRAQPRGSHAQPPLWRAWRARRALSTLMVAPHGAFDQAASELPLPLPTIPTALREAELGRPSTSAIRSPLESVILLRTRASGAAQSRKRPCHAGVHVGVLR